MGDTRAGRERKGAVTRENERERDAVAELQERYDEDHRDGEHRTEREDGAAEREPAGDT